MRRVVAEVPTGEDEVVSPPGPEDQERKGRDREQEGEGSDPCPLGNPDDGVDRKGELAGGGPEHGQYIGSRDPKLKPPIRLCRRLPLGWSGARMRVPTRDPAGGPGTRMRRAPSL